jgi:hypothetical protein
MAKKLSEIPDGAGVRFRHLENSGFEYVGTVKDGRIEDPNGDLRTPSGAAREVDKLVRPDEWRDGWSPTDWEWFSGDGWEEVKTE